MAALLWSYFCVFLSPTEKEMERRRGKIKKFSGLCRTILAFLDPSLSILYCNNNNGILPWNGTYVLKASSDKALCLVFTLTVRWGAGLVKHPLDM